MFKSISSPRIAALLGSASICTMAATTANAQVAEVLITGSLIAGTQAVGVPVTSLGETDFVEAGAINVLELLETQPALLIPPTNSPAYGAGTLHFANNVQIHGLGVGDTLMMQDGRRWPLQGYDAERVDPAIFPQLAVARVDVLTAGASATYGADAIAGVINVILKRDIDGAETMLRFGGAPGAGNENVTFAQLYGTSWDTGNVTMTWEVTHNRHTASKDLFWYDWDFGNGGFPGFDFTDVASSAPGFVTDDDMLDAENQALKAAFDPDYESPAIIHRNKGINCVNCFSVPNGVAPGSTFSWDQLGVGVNADNIRNPWTDGAWARPSMESTAFVGNMHQRLTPNLNLFGVDWGPVRVTFDGMWSNRRFKQNYPSDQGQGRENMSPPQEGYVVPSHNPYYPTGPVPDNFNPDICVPNPNPNWDADGEAEEVCGDFRTHFTFAPQLDTPIISGGAINSRWTLGLEFDELPFNWHGRIDYSLTDSKNYGYDRGGILPNMVSAALGNEVEISPLAGDGDVVFTKPDNIPYLNPFCDSVQFGTECNSPATIAYIQGFRDQIQDAHFSEFNVQFDGPIFELPAGPVVIALAYNHLVKSQKFQQVDNTNSGHTDQIVIGTDYINELSNALIFQANLPLLGPGFNAPLFEALDVEFGYRVDEYDNLDKRIWTPKIAANWTVGMGLTLRGSWGKSFRTPKGEEISLSGVGITALNRVGGIERSDTTVMECDQTGGTPPSGTLTAILNPMCSDEGNSSLFAPLGIDVSGNPAGTQEILERSGLLAGLDTTLGPQNAKQFNIGLNFAPGPEHFGGLLTGLNVDVTWWKLTYKDLIGGIFAGTGPSDPRSRPFYIPITNPNAPITDPSNAAFWQLTQDLAALPTRTSRAPSPGVLEQNRFIQISTTGNVGEAEYEGIDFNLRYDWEWGNMGSFHVGASGAYRLKKQTRSDPEGCWVDPLYEECLDGTGRLTAEGNQLERVRYRAGWTNGTWNFTTFFNYFGHHQNDVFGARLLPDCFYREGFAAGDCYPGSPYFGPYPNDKFPIMSPANVLVDVTLGFNTGTRSTNEYLHNINIQFGVTNLLDKTPPLGVQPLRSRGTGVALYDRLYPDLAREVSVTITKQW
jgi:outer membrane receptor protein involved in Fe transport